MSISSKKIIKKIILLISLFSILPYRIYAVDASAGDAFVTKEEFDNVLSDFNRRLTTFEAGVNSKIDAQVTSYLDRNGIWSKKSQTMKNTATGYFGIKAGAGNMFVSHYWYDDAYVAGGPGTSPRFTNGQSATWHSATAGDNNHTIVLVDKIDKAGLMMLTYSKEFGTYNTDISGQGTFMAGKATNDRIVGDQVAANINMRCDFIEKTALEENIKYTDRIEVFYTVPAEFVATRTTGIIKFFFVEKNSSLIAKCTDSSYVNLVAIWGGSYKARYYNIKAEVY